MELVPGRNLIEELQMLRMAIFGLGAFLILGTSDLQGQVHPDRRAAHARWEAVQTKQDKVNDRRVAQARRDAIQDHVNDRRRAKARRDALRRLRRIRAHQQ